MAYKIVFRNDKTGSVTIDENYRNLSFAYKTDIGVGGPQVLDFPLNEPYVKCLYSEHGTTINHAYDPYINVNEYYVRWAVALNPATVYIFKDLPIPAAKYGMNVRNPETGVINFSTAMKPMRVVDAASGTTGMWDQEAIYEKQFDPSRKYAVALGSLPCRISTSGANSSVMGLFVQTTGGKVTVKSVKIANFRANTRGEIYTQSYNFLVVDVTDY